MPGLLVAGSAEPLHPTTLGHGNAERLVRLRLQREVDGRDKKNRRQSSKDGIGPDRRVLSPWCIRRCRKEWHWAPVKHSIFAASVDKTSATGWVSHLCGHPTLADCERLYTSLNLNGSEQSALRTSGKLRRRLAPNVQKQANCQDFFQAPRR